MSLVSQTISGVFRIASDLGFPSGKNSGIGNNVFKILSPDKSPSSSSNVYNGGTLVKIYDTHLDVSSGPKLLHLQTPAFDNNHFQIGVFYSGIKGGLDYEE